MTRREQGMKVLFFPEDIDSDVITVSDDTTEEELSDMACEWVADNVAGLWKIISEGDEE